MSKVAIIMGSASDWDVMSPACTTLEEFGISYEKKVLSAHRNPGPLADYVRAALLSIVQMPSGIPVATMAIDGSKNAALYAVAILALQDDALRKKLEGFRQQQSDKVLQTVI